MRLDEALRGVAAEGAGGEDVAINGVQYDSRRVVPGDIFVAMRGGATDGTRFIAKAIAQGAAAIVTDSREVFASATTVPVFYSEHGRRALAGVSANVFGHPEQKLRISAVTGTNGKTTTAFLLEQMLRSVDRKCVLISTIETHIGDEIRPSEHTTPESRDLLSLFADGVHAAATEAVMEMSSHALEQERVWGLPVDVALFTNLTQDHLDYHGTMEAYFAAKARMFEGVGAPAPRVAVLNADDPDGGAHLLKKNLVSEVMSYGTSAGEYRAESVQLAAGRTSFQWRTPVGTVPIQSALTGRVNVYNLLAASCAALARGLTLAQVADAAARVKPVPGRFEAVANSLGIAVVVDYAHTDDALRNLITLARELVGQGHVITLFGCGGDRDRTKRPKMGRAAGEGSDLVILTSDNPRTEEPAAILAEALAGVRETDVPCIVEEDRAAAIAIAIKAAKPGDIVLLAGKGHEKVQILKTGTIPFDDVTVAAEVLRKQEQG